MKIPHDIEAEQALLGAIMLDNGVFGDVSRIIDAAKFYDPVHARIFEAASDLIANGSSAAAHTIKARLANDGGLQELGGPRYLAGLMNTTISVRAAPEYAEIVREMAQRREIVRIGQDMAHAAAERYDEDTDAVVERAEGELIATRSIGLRERRLISFSQAMAGATERINEAYQRDGVPEIATGLERLDDIIHGLHRGHLMFLGARTSMGKTAVALNMAAAIAERGERVVFVSLEMPRTELAARLAARHLAMRGRVVPYSKLNAGDVSEDDMRRFLQAAIEMKDLPISVADEGCTQLDQVRALCRDAIRAGPVSAVFVDYFQLVRVPGMEGNRVAEVSHVARSLKNMARELNVPIIALAQVDRRVEQRENRIPMLSDIRWAGEAEESADAVIFVHRPAYYYEKDAKDETDEARKSELLAMADRHRNVVALHVAKNRAGPLGECLIWGDMATNFFTCSAPNGARRAEDFR